MNWKICLSVMAVATSLACGGGKSDGGTAGGGTLTISAAPPTGVLANGVNAVIVHVDGSTKGPIVIRTDRGHFQESGAVTATNPTTPFDVTLVSCDSQVAAGCAGNATLNASDQNLATGRIQVRFVQVEMCANGLDDDGDVAIDCADADCAARSCGANGLTCGAANLCECPSGQAHELPAQCSAAAPIDNDCDGRAGCADSDCLGLTCATGTAVGGRPLFGSCKAGGACTCVPTQGTKETSCGDGLDNDCDGLIDCEDPNCQPAGNTPGQACDPTHPGLTCSAPPVAGGPSACSVCAPGGSFVNAQLIETKCGDTIDNDCSGRTDCLDPNCADKTLVCGANGERCTVDLQCRCPDTTGVETSCGDGLDNDCDARKDCADTDCSAQTCGPNGLTCTGGLCKCPGGQVNETSCNDGQDNDCDGLVDCADPGCQPTTVGGLDGKACVSGPSRAGEKCDSLGRCACPGGQAVETSCDDHLDNDCNGLIDCADPSCLGMTCGLHALTCTSTSLAGCTCPTGATEACDDKSDNNCDGLVDCQDVGCANAACDTVNGTYRCLLQDTTRAYNAGTNPYLCRDASQFAITVTPGVTRLAANGTSTTAVVAFLQDVNAHTVVSGGNITFGTTLGTFLGAGAPGTTIPATTGVDGKATVTLVSSASAGTAVVSAQYVYNAGANSVTGSTTVVMPQLSQITLAKQQYAIMGALGSGYQESNELTFQLTDSANQAYPPGLAVTVTHQSVGGSFIGADPAACDPVDKLCSVTLLTDGAGQVKIILHAGTQATVTSVTTTATGGGTTVTFNSGNIAIIGAKASGNEISINCTPKNVPALIDTDCTKSNYAGAGSTITCTVSLADRFKNKLGVATLVEMRPEAGAAGLPTSTPAYSLSNPPANLGKAVNTITVNGYGLPSDVTPFLGEYSLDNGWDGCPTKTHNPRDGLVTVIAAVTGEEGFVDGSNGCPADGVYNVAGSYAGFPTCLGEYFIDLGEPFVDNNDTGIRDANEYFIDANGNGSYDGPNNAWDAKTSIWAETRVLYSGYTQAARRISPSAPTPPPPPPLDELASRFYASSLPPAPSPQLAPSVASMLTTPPSEPEPLPPGFSVLAARTGPPAQPATSDVVPVYFTDENFNLPTSQTTYTVAPQTGAKITAVYSSSPVQPDSLGMNYTTQFCAKGWTDPTTQCFSSCQFPICLAVTNVGTFSHGTYGSVTITGGPQPDGAVCVYATSSLTSGGVTGRLTLPVCGTSN